MRKFCIALTTGTLYFAFYTSFIYNIDVPVSDLKIAVTVLGRTTDNNLTIMEKRQYEKVDILHMHMQILYLTKQFKYSSVFT